MADGGVVSAPVGMAIGGALLGSQMDRKNPMRGAALGGLGGYMAAPMMGAGAAAGAGAAGTGVAAGGATLATPGLAFGSAMPAAGGAAGMTANPAMLGGSVMNGGLAFGNTVPAATGMGLTAGGATIPTSLTAGAAGSGASGMFGKMFSPEMMGLQGAGMLLRGQGQQQQRPMPMGAPAPALNPQAGAGQSFAQRPVMSPTFQPRPTSGYFS